MNKRVDDYYFSCEPSEYSDEELTYILANCGPTEDQAALPPLPTHNDKDAE